uniref:C2H2-type domain-containing protein n=1 Tax=Strigamia maritima TaxID=126957 RepID=T1J9F8_STRMM
MKTPTKNEWNEVKTPQRQRRIDRNLETTPPMNKDAAIYPWNWGEGARRIQLSPSGANERESEEIGKQQRNANLRRGRPRADSITGLILKGSTSPSNIKCQICNRVFPRDKSLQAHLRTHTGERPYRCDFPGCDRAFTQSGQLKTHQRLHTGEKPFVCSANGCANSFAHANRHCPQHPFATLQRVQKTALDANASASDDNNIEVLQWLEKYRRARDEKPTSKLRDRKLKRELDQQAYWEQINSPQAKNMRQDSPTHSNVSDSTDEWLGALALIQLAQTSSCQPLNLSFQK